MAQELFGKGVGRESIVATNVENAKERNRIKAGAKKAAAIALRGLAYGWAAYRV